MMPRRERPELAAEIRRRLGPLPPEVTDQELLRRLRGTLTYALAALHLALRDLGRAIKATFKSDLKKVRELFRKSA